MDELQNAAKQGVTRIVIGLILFFPYIYEPVLV